MLPKEDEGARGLAASWLGEGPGGRIGRMACVRVVRCGAKVLRPGAVRCGAVAGGLAGLWVCVIMANWEVGL